jgi:DNA-binding CsgD family transcriptional regulator
MGDILLSMMTIDVKSLLKIDSRHWHEQVAAVIITEGTPDFPAVLVRALRHIVPFDYSVWFVFWKQDRPVCVYDSFTPEQRVIFVEDYQEGPYLLDPFCIACADRVDPGLYRLRDIAPDRFYHSEYFRSYYRRTGLAEEIAFLINLGQERMLCVSLMRAGTSPTFSDRDMNKLRKAEPVVHATAARQWKFETKLRDHYIDSVVDDVAIDGQVSSAFENFGKDKLTPRESEIVRMVLRGHSSESIGRHCGITTGTVKIHRKNIYAKLGISSQSELFSLFISEI